MANRWLFAGGDIGMMRGSGSPATDTTSGRFNSTYCDHCISLTNANFVYADFVDSAGASDSVTGTETMWFRATYFMINNATGANIFEFVNSADQPWLALRQTAAGTVGLYYNSNTGASPTWTLIGSTFAFSVSTLHVVDMKLTLGSPHSAELYVDGVLKANGTFTQASLTAIDAVAIKAPSASGGFAAEFMATVGISTIGGHVYYGKPTGSGSNSGFGSGTFADIDDVGINDADFIASPTAAQRATYAYANVPALSGGQALGDLFMWTRAKNDGSAPTKFKPVRRDSGGTDNVGSAVTVTAGFADYLTRYSGVNETEYNASEFGAESDT